MLKKCHNNDSNYRQQLKWLKARNEVKEYSAQFRCKIDYIKEEV